MSENKMKANEIKRNLIFTFEGKATQWKVTRTVGETVYYRLAKTPYYLYSNTPVHTATKTELAKSAYNTAHINMAHSVEIKGW